MKTVVSATRGTTGLSTSLPTVGSNPTTTTTRNGVDRELHNFGNFPDFDRLHFRSKMIQLSKKTKHIVQAKKEKQLMLW
mgnify:CR=1 FL=1